jgi:hypothetical protein
VHAGVVSALRRSEHGAPYLRHVRHLDCVAGLVAVKIRDFLDVLRSSSATMSAMTKQPEERLADIAAELPWVRRLAIAVASDAHTVRTSRRMRCSPRQRPVHTEPATCGRGSQGR